MLLKWDAAIEVTIQEMEADATEGVDEDHLHLLFEKDLAMGFMALSYIGGKQAIFLVQPLKKEEGGGWIIYLNGDPIQSSFGNSLYQCWKDCEEVAKEMLKEMEGKPYPFVWKQVSWELRDRAVRFESRGTLRLCDLN